MNEIPPTEIGFFIHHPIQHDTIESKTHLQRQLPFVFPTFQKVMSQYGQDCRTPEEE
jgi:hypothetical protein